MCRLRIRLLMDGLNDIERHPTVDWGHLAATCQTRCRPCRTDYSWLYYREWQGGENVQLPDPRNSKLQSPVE